MIYFTAHTFKCVCHCIRTMFRVLGVYNFEGTPNYWSFHRPLDKDGPINYHLHDQPEAATQHLIMQQPVSNQSGLVKPS